LCINLVCNVVGEPVKSFVKSFTRCGTCALDIPAREEHGEWGKGERRQGI